MQNRVSVAWFASAFVGRTASGTAQTARKIVEYVLLNESKRINLILIVKDDYEMNIINKDKTLSQASLILLPKVKGNFLKSSRQFYKYALRNKTKEIDILHFSVARLYPFYWTFPAKKFFCTFHAGGDVSLPQDKFVASRLVYNFIAKLYWRNLDNIFAVSEFGKYEIEACYGIPSKDIKVIHPGTDHLWNIEVEEIELDRSKCNIAIIGRWQKYKNVHTVLSAFSKLDDLHLKNFHIFLVGRSNFSNSLYIQQLISRLSTENITCYDYLPDAQLKYLYQNADLIIHPSINEGFGIPAFEAFAEGSPIAVHQGLPADTLLHNQSQVYVIDMLSVESIVHLLKNYLIFRRVEVEKRRKYLIENSMVWNQMCAKYVQAYLET